MPVLVFDFPSDAEDELVRRFTVNKNYVQAIAHFIENRYGQREEMYAGLNAALAHHGPYARVQRSQPNVDEVRRYLALGWASEIQLHLPTLIGQEAMISFANAWAPVHAYYSVFGALQAWFAANDMVGMHDDHTATLRTISGMIDQRKLLPPPWNLLAVGCAPRGERAYINDDGEDCAGDVEVLSIPVSSGDDPTFWPRYGTWLRSTRRARLERKEEEWKAKHDKKRISPKVREQFAKTLHGTSLFDCFWRLRIKSNYGTIDAYLVTHISDEDHATFNRSLCTMTRASVCLLELYVCRKVGRPQFKEIADEFLKQDRSGLSDFTVGKRLAAYGLVSTPTSR